MLMTDEEKEIVDKILRFYAPEYEIWAFGSRVTGKRLKPTSDLDLVIINEQHLPIRQYAQIKDAFEISYLPFRVDVLEWSRTSEEFRKIIAENYEVVHSLS